MALDLDNLSLGPVLNDHIGTTGFDSMVRKDKTVKRAEWSSLQVRTLSSIKTVKMADIDARRFAPLPSPLRVRVVKSAAYKHKLNSDVFKSSA